MANKFKVIKDGYDWMVADASVGAYSFAMIPSKEASMFDTRAEAEKQVQALNGREIECRMIETPDRFEDVADTKYGSAWE